MADPAIQTIQKTINAATLFVVGANINTLLGQAIITFNDGSTAVATLTDTERKTIIGLLVDASLRTTIFSGASKI